MQPSPVLLCLVINTKSVFILNHLVHKRCTVAVIHSKSLKIFLRDMGWCEDLSLESTEGVSLPMQEIR